MATKPGILTEWPWTWLGNFKYVVLAPFVVDSTYSFLVSKDESKRDVAYLLILPLMFLRLIHYQMWITLCRYRTAKGDNRIVDKSIEFHQIDIETNWDDQIIFSAVLFYLGYLNMEQSHDLPIWKTDGIIMTILLHIGPVEFLMYWLHRALHHHFLYSRYHSQHHSAIATQPITTSNHAFAEHAALFMVYSIPIVTTLLKETASMVSICGYLTFVDFMNNMGHCNLEIIPKWIFSIFPPFKYLMFTPSFHSLHHTQVRTNYALFMPLYDVIYNTFDKSSDILYKKSVEREGESPDVVHLTHLTTPESLYHLRLGFSSLASKPYTSKWYFPLMWPITLSSMILTWIYSHTFVLERNVFNNLKLQTWVIPKYRTQYFNQRQRGCINNLIEEAIMDADQKGVKVLSLGLLNHGQWLNKNGEQYIRRHPQLKLKLVDGSSLASALVLNSIPKGTFQVVLRGHLSKVAYSIALALCQGGVKIVTLREEEYKRLKENLPREAATNLVPSEAFTSETWLVGEGLSDEEQSKAPKGTLFIPFSQFPPRKVRQDCFYFNTPAMITPKHLENMDSCEQWKNWLPRKVMSAWRIAGILHASEGWQDHECGNMMFDIDKVWKASLDHGFLPLTMPTKSKV